MVITYRLSSRGNYTGRSLAGSRTRSSDAVLCGIGIRNLARPHSRSSPICSCEARARDRLSAAVPAYPVTGVPWDFQLGITLSLSWYEPSWAGMRYYLSFLPKGDHSLVHFKSDRCNGSHSLSQFHADAFLYGIRAFFSLLVHVPYTIQVFLTAPPA